MSGEHEYPDPDYVPRFPWLGSQDHRASTEVVGHLPFSPRPTSPEKSLSRDPDTERAKHFAHRPGQDRSPDPDYDYHEDSAK